MRPVEDDDVEYARWSRRVVGALLDEGLLAGVTWLALGEEGRAPWLSIPVPDQDGQVPWTQSWWVVAAVAVVLLLQAWTGWSPGKLVVGIAVVRDRDLRPAGLLRTLVRWPLHILDSILFIGLLRPLWHRERRTFADSIVGTVVVRRRPVGLGREREYVLTASALVLCLAGTGLTTTWASWNGDTVRVAAPCDPQPPSGTSGDVARLAATQIMGVEVRAVERRLWTRRITDRQRNYWAEWTWNATTVPRGDLALELTVTGPSGRSVSGRTGIAGRSNEATTTTATAVGTGTDLLTAQVSIDDGAATSLGAVVDARTSLLVDGRVVATCAVDGVVLPAATP
jgi:Mce-associated membrane protein